jgi:hypothetical protein
VPGPGRTGSGLGVLDQGEGASRLPAGPRRQSEVGEQVRLLGSVSVALGLVQRPEEPPLRRGRASLGQIQFPPRAPEPLPGQVQPALLGEGAASGEVLRRGGEVADQQEMVRRVVVP